MGIVDRVKKICLSPTTEWPVVAAEPATPGGLLGGYAAPLILVSALAALIGSMFFWGILGGGVGLAVGLGSTVFGVVMQFVFVSILAALIMFLAPTFGAQKDLNAAFKVAVYSCTAVWVAGVAQIIPFLGGIITFIGAIFSIYLMYLGLSPVMKSPSDKSPAYAAVVVVAMLVVGFTLLMTSMMIGFAGLMGAGGVASMMGRSAPAEEVQFDRDSPLGKLQELGKAMEKSSAEMEAANKSGDSSAAAAAAGNMLGTLFGGGKKVDPLQLDQLKTFVPDTFAGLNKEGTGTAERNGIAGLMVSKAGATYSDGGSRQVELEIVDSGGASGIMGLASWVGMAEEKEDSSGSERNRRVDGRWTHERDSRDGTDEYAVMVGERFMVTARSSDLELGALKSAVGSLNLSGLDALKDSGVQKP
jgi:hypothetical protein